LSLKPTWYGIMGMIVTQTRNPFFLVVIYDKNFFKMFKLFVAKTWPNSFRSNKKDQSTVHASPRAGRMTKAGPIWYFAIILFFRSLYSESFVLDAWSWAWIFLSIIYYFLFIYYREREFHFGMSGIYMGTVRYAHDHANETFTVVVL